MFKTSIQNYFQLKTESEFCCLYWIWEEKQRLYLLALIGDFFLNVIRRIRRELLKAMFMHGLNRRDTLTMLCFRGKTFSFPFSLALNQRDGLEVRKLLAPALPLMW